MIQLYSNPSRENKVCGLSFGFQFTLFRLAEVKSFNWKGRGGCYLTYTQYKSWLLFSTCVKILFNKSAKVQELPAHTDLTMSVTK